MKICASCNGSGRVADEPCPACGGSGKERIARRFGTTGVMVAKVDGKDVPPVTARVACVFIRRLWNLVFLRACKRPSIVSPRSSGVPLASSFSSR